jgi:hypothetical protein
MPETSPPSSRISQLPPTSGGGGLWILAVLVLVACIGGLICWKVKSNDTPAPIASVPLAATTPAALADPPPPPPPPDEPEAGPPEAGVKMAAGNGGGTGGGSCGASKCSGSAGPPLTSALSARAGSARGCYERALRVNAMLQGKLVVGVRVDSTGAVCNTSIAQDGIHSNEVSSCVLGMFRGAHFPPPSGGCVDVNVPMSFVPREGK